VKALERGRLRGKVNGMLRKVTLLIPLTFNDGTSVPGEVLEKFREEVFVAFQGWTQVGQVEGSYRMQTTGAKQVDRLLQVWVVVDDQAIPELKQMVARLGSLLGQESMYFEESDAKVEFIRLPREGDGKDASTS
jgi:hypothetical protein